MITQWLRDLFAREKLQIPDQLWRDCIAKLPFLDRLSDDDLARLKGLSEIFLHRKSISGAAGLEVSNDIAVMISAQACLLILNLTLDLYDDMPGVVVYPSEFIVPRSEVDEAGVVHEWEEPLAGEALEASRRFGGRLQRRHPRIRAQDRHGARRCERLPTFPFNFSQGYQSEGMEARVHRGIRGFLPPCRSPRPAACPLTRLASRHHP